MKIFFRCLMIVLCLAFHAGRSLASEPAIPPQQPRHFTASYPVPYEIPTVQSIRSALESVHSYLDQAIPTRIIDHRTGAEIADLTKPNADAVPARNQNGLGVIDYTTGVIHLSMLLASDVTKDPRYAAFTARHLQFIHDSLPYFRDQHKSFGKTERSFGQIIETDSLDASGAMCAALIQARRANVGPDLKPVIDHWSNYIHTKQFRIADGTLARRRPQPESLWSDDIYMSVPALALMGKLTGDRSYTDDAAKQMLQFSKHLFNWNNGLFMHGRNLNQPDNPEFYWGRANGWAMMANVELLEVLPEDHPGRAELVKILRAHIKGVSTLQSGSGLWRQMLDKPDSYLETSATAMFVYAIARAINRGWISPASYGSVAQAGWNGLTTRITPTGQVDGTCVGTTFASDNVYYYNRPANVYAAHGYGPVIMAGAEMIRLLENPAVTIKFQWNTYHYIPKAK